MKHLQTWKTFNEGRMIDFNTRKEIIDNTENSIDKVDDISDIVEDETHDFDYTYANPNDPFIKIFVKDDEKVAIVKDSSNIEGLVKSMSKFMFRDYLFIINMNEYKNKPSMLIVKKAPKSKIGYKIVSNYLYPKGLDRIVEVVKEFIDNKIKNETVKSLYKQQQKDTQNKIKSNIDKYLSVGDIYYTSWGYEQTNIDFYQVVKFNNSYAWVQEINSEIVEGTEGHDSVNVKPVKDSFTKNSTPIKKLIQINGKGDDVSITFKMSSYARARKYDRGDRGLYSSWGY